MIQRNATEDRLSNLLRDSSVFANNNDGDLSNTIPTEELWRLFVEDLPSKNSGETATLKARTTLQQQLGLTDNEISRLTDDGIKRLQAGVLSHDESQTESLQTLPPAYEFIFKRTDKLSLPLILDMHRAMTVFLSQGTDKSGGQLRTAHISSTALDKEFTHDGIIELLNEFDPHTAYLINGMIIYKTTLLKLIRGETVPNAEAFAQQFPELLQYLLTATDDRDIFGEVIYKMIHTDGIQIRHCHIIDDHDNISKKLANIINELVTDFNREIANKSLSPAQKMQCIVALIRRLVRVHPFDHYSLPTLTIILFQHLLMNHLSVLSVLPNPRAFYTHSTLEITDKVANGIEHVVAIINKRAAFGTKANETLIVTEQPNPLGIRREIFDLDAEKQNKLRGFSELGKQHRQISMFKLAANPERVSAREAYEADDKAISCCICIKSSGR